MNNKKKKNMLPALAMAGPVSVWMILFVTIPMLYIIYISFMSRGVFGDVVYKFSTESYKTILNPTYFKVILKSLKAAGITTILCLLLGYPLAYIIAHKPKDTAAKLITLIMIPFWTNSLMRLNSWLLLFQTSGPINNFLVGTGIVKEPITFIYTDGLVLIGLLLSVVPLIRWMPGLLFDGNEAEIRTFLERSLDIVIGIEFIKMLAKHSPGSSLEVLLYAIARHMILGHGSAVDDLISVISIGLIFLIRKFVFVPSFGSSMPDGQKAPDMVECNHHDSDETFG